MALICQSEDSIYFFSESSIDSKLVHDAVVTLPPGFQLDDLRNGTLLTKEQGQLRLFYKRGASIHVLQCTNGWFDSNSLFWQLQRGSLR